MPHLSGTFGGKNSVQDRMCVVGPIHYATALFSCFVQLPVLNEENLIFPSPSSLSDDDDEEEEEMGKLNVKFGDEGLSMQVDSKGIEGEKEELSESMNKLKMVEQLPSGRETGVSSSNFKKKPLVVIVVGMAGRGKTTFLHRLVCHTQASNIRGYVLNLYPAVMTLPFGANIDIRDTVRYKEVMKQFNLGPKGGIQTYLNLFATKFDEVISTMFLLTHTVRLRYSLGLLPEPSLQKPEWRYKQV